MISRIKELNIFSYCIIVLACIVTLLPFIWMISTSLKTSGAIYQMPPSFIPEKFNWSNYSDVVSRVPMSRYFFNSIAVSVIITVGSLITTVLASFAFSRVKFWGRDVVFSIMLGTMMIPSEMLLAPNFVTLSRLGLINTMPALFLPWLVSTYSIFLLRQFFLTVPEELYYAAKVDGCGDLKYLLTIMIPVSKPALITIALLRMIYSWNEFLWPLLVTNTPDMRTLPVGLTNFMTEAGTQYNLLMAYSSIVIIPIVIIYVLLQKHILRGITKGGIKG